MTERIAVIRLSSLGDIVCTGPAVRGLRLRFPDARITFITSTPYAELAEMLPGVDDVLTVRRRGRGFQEDGVGLIDHGPWDHVADLQGSPRSNKLVRLMGPHHVLRFTPPRVRRTAYLYTRFKFGGFAAVPDRMRDTLAPWGVLDDGQSLSLNVPQSVRQDVLERWGAGADEAILLVPGAKHRTKQWPGQYWSELVRTLPRNRSIIVIGAKGDMPDDLKDLTTSRILDLTGDTSIPEMVALIDRASVVVSGDTGPMHLAVACGTASVAMFGPTVREFGFAPYRHAQSEVLERPLACRPCSAHGGKQCPLGHHRCLRDIHPITVMRAVERALEPQLAGRRKGVL